jgi:Protein of unknown function (DUF2946)
MRQSLRGQASLAVALLALLMLGYASVCSSVMQAAGMTPSGLSTICGDPGMNGMSMPGVRVLAAMGASHHGHQPGDNAKHPAACPYCAAAANPAMMSGVTPLRIQTSFVFVAFHPVESHGPRGPPAFKARARGPPLDLTPA